MNKHEKGNLQTVNLTERTILYSVVTPHNRHPNKYGIYKMTPFWANNSHKNYQLNLNNRFLYRIREDYTLERIQIIQRNLLKDQTKFSSDVNVEQYLTVSFELGPCKKYEPVDSIDGPYTGEFADYSFSSDSDDLIN